MDKFIEQVKNFGLANWILLAASALIIIFMIIMLVINSRIMKQYRLDMKKTRVARVVGRLEIINGWCCIVIENKGQEIATGIKVKCTGSIMRYYYDYIARCRVDDMYSKLVGKSFMLVPGDKKQVKLFPINERSEQSIIMNGGIALSSGQDVNLTGMTESSDTLSIDELFDERDKKVLKAVNKKEMKLAKLKAKNDAKYRKLADKIDVKRQKKLRKINKKNNKLTHTSLLEQPDIRPLIEGASIKFDIRYESIGYYMKNKYKYKNLELRDFPEELKSANDIIKAQNSLLEQMIVLQSQTKNILNETLNKRDE